MKKVSETSKAFVDHLRDQLRKEDKLHLCALLLIFLLGIAIRLHFLSEPLLQDETQTFVKFAFKPLYIGLTDYSLPNNHLFHTFLVHMAYVLLGYKPWMLRLPALFAGILIVPASYAVVRILYDKDTALISTGLVAASAPLVRYSILARGYSLMCLFFLLTLIIAVYLRRSRHPNASLLFAVLAALGFYTIPLMAYPFGIVVTWLVLSIFIENPRSARAPLLKDLFRSLVMGAFLTVTLYLPVFIVSGVKSVVANETVARVSWSYFIGNFPPFARIIWEDWNKEIPAVISLILIAGFFISLVFHKRLSKYPVPIAIATFLWLIPVLIVQQVIPPERTWLFLLPVYFGTASSGLTYSVSAIRRLGSYKSVICTVLAIALSASVTMKVLHTPYIYDPIGTVRDAEQITLFLKDYLKPGDAVLAPDAQTLYIYYFTLHDVPLQYLEFNPENSGRIFVLTCEYRERAEAALANRGSSVSERLKRFFPNYSEARLIRQYQFASIYEVDKIAAWKKEH